jgi:hypothetical protein
MRHGYDATPQLVPITFPNQSCKWRPVVPNRAITQKHSSFLWRILRVAAMLAARPPPIVVENEVACETAARFAVFYCAAGT